MDGATGEMLDGARVFAGEWFCTPDPESESIRGTLTFDGDGGTLDLPSAFSAGISDDGQTHTLFGRLTDGSLMTLPNAHHLGQSWNLHGVTRDTWGCFVALKGRWIPDDSVAEFQAFSLETECLRQWGGVRALPSRREGTDGEIGLSIRLPAIVKASIPDLGSLTLWWGYSYSSGLEKSTISVRPQWQLSTAKPMTFDIAWQEFVVPLIHFMTLATGTHDRVIRFFAHTEDLSFKGIEHIGTVWQSTSDHGEHRPHEYLLPRQVVLERFEDLMVRWFHHSRDYRAALLRFFSVEESPSYYSDDSFDRVLRALEAWHRGKDAGLLMPHDDYDALLDAISAAAPAHEQFLRQRLRHANSISLKDRLDRMLTLAASPVEPVARRFPRLVRRSVDTRNGLAHLGDPGSHLKPSEMMQAQVIWQLVMRSVLLREMGLSTEDVSGAIRRTRERYVLA